MRRSLTALLLALPLLCVPLARAAETPAPDTRIANQLKALGYQYEVDGDGDFKLTFEVSEESKRTQLVFVRSAVETYGDLRIREIWSPGYSGTSDQLPVAVANHLLTASMESKVGGWGKQGNGAIFIIRIPADASNEVLDTAMSAAMQAGDAMESALTPEKDAL